MPTNEGTFCIDIRRAFPLLHSALIFTKPAGASNIISVSGSCIGIIPVSKRTVATQMAFDPDIGGVVSGSIIIQPICAFGLTAGTKRFTCLKTPPLGSLSTKLRRVLSFSIHVRCSQRVSPGGGATPPTITSPTSPSAWHETTWITFELLIFCWVLWKTSNFNRFYLFKGFIYPLC